MGFAIFGLTRTPSGFLDPFNIQYDAVLDLIVATDFKFWTDSIINLTGFGLTIAVDLFFPTRYASNQSNFVYSPIHPIYYPSDYYPIYSIIHLII